MNFYPMKITRYIKLIIIIIPVIDKFWLINNEENSAWSFVMQYCILVSDLLLVV